MCLLFHSWVTKQEQYAVHIPAHDVSLGGFDIHEPETTDKMSFEVRTCLDCGKRQKRRYMSTAWDDWYFNPGDTIQSKIIGQRSFMKQNNKFVQDKK